MSNIEDHVKGMISKLEQERDELAVQIHLGKAEAKEEFESAKKKLAKMSQDLEPAKDAMKESAENVWSSLELVGGEILASFKRVRDSL
jgi:seryl-tRNA synthetase